MSITTNIQVQYPTGVQTRTIIVDNEHVAYAATNYGSWLVNDVLSKRDNKKRLCLFFLPHPQHALQGPNGKPVQSFLPYIGIKEGSRRHNPLLQFDFRLEAYKNADTRRVDVADYLPNNPEVPTNKKAREFGFDTGITIAPTLSVQDRYIVNQAIEDYYFLRKFIETAPVNVLQSLALAFAEYSL